MKPHNDCNAPLAFNYATLIEVHKQPKVRWVCLMEMDEDEKTNCPLVLMASYKQIKSA